MGCLVQYQPMVFAGIRPPTGVFIFGYVTDFFWHQNRNDTFLVGDGRLGGGNPA